MKDWKEETRLKIHNVYATVFQLSGYSEQQLKEKEDIIIEHFNSLLSQQRKEVLEEVIEELEEKINDHGFSDEEEVPEFNPCWQVEYFEVLNVIKSLINK